MNKCKHIFLSLVVLASFFVSEAQDTTVVEEVTPPDVMMDSVYTTSTSPLGGDDQFREVTAGTVDSRTVSSQSLEKARADEDYWYVNEAPPREKEKTDRPEEKEKKDVSLFKQPWFVTLMWVLLIAGFLALLVWFLSTGNIAIFRRARKVADETVDEQSAEDIFEMNFEKELQAAVASKNFRLAVRLMYLRTLRELSDRNLITYTHEKTNSAYLFQLAGTDYYRNFFRLTRSFDYTWYGQFGLSEDSFAIIQNDFNNFRQQLAS